VAPADITVESDVESVFETIRTGPGRLDIAVNNAGIWEPGFVADIDDATWHRVLETNLTGVALSACRDQGHVGVRRGRDRQRVVDHRQSAAIPGTGAYGATKAAIEALTRIAAKEYIGSGIRINTVSPSAMDTEMSLLPGETEAERDARLGATVPAGRIATVDEAARAILWACSPDASFFVGHDFVVDGGLTT